MAIGSSSLHFRIPGSGVSKFSFPKVFMPSSKRKSSAPIACFSYNKVFEDQSKGIVCYRDERGEVICEGYDEGPRFCQPALPKSYHHSLPSREVQIPDYCLQTVLRTSEGIEFRCIKMGVYSQDEDSDFKGFNGHF